MSATTGGIGNGGTEALRNRFLGFLIWQSVQSTLVYLLCKCFLFAPFTSSPFKPSLSGCFAFLVFHLSQLLFSFSVSAVASPQPQSPAAASELFYGLIRLIFVSGGQPLPPDFLNRARLSFKLMFLMFALAFLGNLSLICLCWNCLDYSFGGDLRREYRWGFVGKLGLRGIGVGLFFGLSYIYRRRWVLDFPIIQRPPFFSYKMGLPLAARRAIKLSVGAFLVAEVLAVSFGYDFKGQDIIGIFIAEKILTFLGVFVVFFCWELNHHLHQVLHTKRLMFAPPKGSAAAETNPTEPLLAALEESTPRSLMQYLAYLDLCMVCENNVDTWRRAAFFEETGETYKRVTAVCLRPLEQLASNMGECLESYSADKPVHIGNQLQSPTNPQLDSRIQEIFYDFQLCTWCAQVLTSLTVRSHKEDRYGVAQLSGSNTAVISTLLSSLLAVETFMGKKTHLQSQVLGSAGIKWATLSTGRKESGTAGPIGKRGTPLYSKAFTVSDILRTSLYSIVSAFYDEMLSSAKAGTLEKDWIVSSKPLYGSKELLVQKLRLFLDFQVS